MLKIEGIYCEVTSEERREIIRIQNASTSEAKERIGYNLLLTSINQNQHSRRAKALQCLYLRCAGENFEELQKKKKQKRSN
jgi:hypothetical protein